MPTLTITSWHEDRPNETCITTVELSAQEHADVNRRGARALTLATQNKLPPPGTWLNISLSEAPNTTPTPRDMRSGAWAARQKAYAPHDEGTLHVVHHVEIDGTQVMRAVLRDLPSYTQARGLA